MLYEHPEWREELRPLVLSEELLRLPETTARTDARLDKIAEKLDALSEIVRLQGEAILHLTERIDALSDRMEARFLRVETQIGRLEGNDLEARYFNHVGAWFGKWLRRPVAVSPEDLPLLEQAIDEGRIDEEQVDEVRVLDLIVRGFDKREADRPETLLAVEVSVTINPEDVARAGARAEILRSAGYRAFGLVGGENLSGSAIGPAERSGVIIDLRRA